MDIHPDEFIKHDLCRKEIDNNLIEECLKLIFKFVNKPEYSQIKIKELIKLRLINIFLEGKLEGLRKSINEFADRTIYFL